MRYEQCQQKHAGLETEYVGYVLISKYEEKLAWLILEYRSSICNEQLFWYEETRICIVFTFDLDILAFFWSRKPL